MAIGQMGRKIFVIGGAKSGKTRYALRLGEGLLSPSERGLYVATCEPKDEEMVEKVRAHKRERSSLWDTLEEKIELERAISSIVNKHYGVILIDCLTLWLLNIMTEHPGREMDYIGGLVHWFDRSYCHVIMVSNEVGLGIVPDNHLARQFRDVAGRVNQLIAQVADKVYFMVSGLSMKLK